MALITTTSLADAGGVVTLGAASVGDSASVGKNLFLVVRNGDVTSKTVTLDVQGNRPSGEAAPDRVITVTANGGIAVIPLLSLYGDGITVNLTYSATTSVTRAVVYAPQ